MRILLTHHLPLEGSASGRATRDLAAGLTEAGHEVLCLVVEGRSPEPQAQSFEVERVYCRPGDPQADLAFDMPCLGAHPFTRLSFAELSEDRLVEYRNALRQKLDRCVERFDPHLIHCQHAWLFAHLALESGAPYVIGAFGSELRAVREDSRYRRFAEQAVENSSRVLVHSRYQAAETAALFPDSAGRIEQVPPPIAVDHSMPAARREELLRSLGLRRDAPLMIARNDLTPESGVGTLLNAQAALAVRGLAAPLVLCGEGPQRAELEAQARHQQLADVYFLGDLPAEELTALMVIADLHLAGSCEAEGFYAALESLLCGTPVIAANCAALPEIIDDRVGGLVEPHDHERLADAIQRALDEQWKKTKGPIARQAAAARFAIRDSVARHVAAYEAALVQRYGSQPPK